MKKRFLKSLIKSLVFCTLFNPLPVNAASLSINEAVALALEQNTALQIVKKGEDSARANLKGARGRNSITISADADYRQNNNNSNPQGRRFSANFGARYPLYSGGKNQADISSNKLGVEIANLNTERKKEDLRMLVIKAYYDVLEAKRTVDVSQESVKNYQAHLTNVEQLYYAGSKAKIDVLRSSVQLADAQQILIRDQNAYEVKVITMKNLLNLSREEELILTDDFKYESFDYGIESCLSYAFDHRKDLLINAHEVRQRELAIKMAQAGYQPTLNVSAGYGTGNTFAPRPETRDRSYSAGLTASWTIFDGGVTHAAVDKAKAERDVAQLTLKKALEDVDLEVETFYYDMREAEKRLVTTQAAVGQAEEDFYIASEKYRAGEGLLLDVLDAQVALSKSQINYLSAQYDYARNKAAVEYSIGLGIGENTDEAMTAAGFSAIPSQLEEYKRQTETYNNQYKHLITDDVNKIATENK